MILTALLVAVLRVGQVLGAEGGPQVALKHGALRGKTVTSPATSKEFLAFRGIPYAKSPTGELRFKDPQPSEPWTGVKDVDQEGAICPQKDLLSSTVNGAEDCLFLNVYTNQLPKDSSDLLKPVMLWIHGGAFILLSGNALLFGPDYLLTKDVVVVTINYRLGALGFLRVDGAESEISGNMGLKDQTLAMKWVKENIAKFGGDPDRVTIFGESAGSASVHYHVLSPMSKGLFHQAICQSGNTLNPWSFRHSLRNNTLKFATQVGCVDTEPRALAACFMKAPVDKLARASMDAFTDEDARSGVPIPFTPTVDGTFLPKAPHQMLKEGNFNRVPFCTGLNTAEGILSLKDVFANDSLLQLIDENLEWLVPEDLGLSLGSPARRQVAAQMRTFYLKGQHLSSDDFQPFVDMKTDTLFTLGTRRSIRLQEQFSKPIFYYQFTYEGSLNVVKMLLGADDVKGVCHADEQGYLFYMSRFGLIPEPGSTDITMLDRMVTMWTDFAKTGNPTPRTSDLIPVKWEPYTTSNPVYLSIGNDLSLKSELDKERMQFWDKIYNDHKPS